MLSGWNSVETHFKMYLNTPIGIVGITVVRVKNTWKVINTTQPLILLMQNPQVKRD